MKLGFGVIFLGIIKAITKILNALFTLVAYILLYFGLWVPCLYLIFWLILWLGLDFNVSVMSLNTVLFYIGLCLSIACSIVIICKNFLLKPIIKISEYRQRKRSLERHAIIDRALKLQKKNPTKYKKQYGDIHPYDLPDMKRQKVKVPLAPQSKPLVYRSQRNSDIIVHEYPDKFEVYTDADGKLEYIETKLKTKKTKDNS